MRGRRARRRRAGRVRGCGARGLRRVRQPAGLLRDLQRCSPALALTAGASQLGFDTRLNALGLDKTFTDTTGSGPAALGNRIAAAVIVSGKTDGSKEDGNYADPSYHPVNQPLIVKVP